MNSTVTATAYGIGGTGAGLFGFCLAGLILIWTAVGLRIWTRTKIIKAFGVDDWLMLAALMCYTWMTVDMMVMVYEGFGRHMSTLPLEQIVRGFMLAIMAEVSYTVTIMFLRLSVCFLYFRLTPLRWQRITLWVLLVVNTLYGVFYFILLLNQCHPLSYAWEMYAGASGTCLPALVVPYASFVHNALSVISDWTLACLPIFLLKNSKLNLKTKVIVCVLLGVGAVASVASIVRFTVLDELVQTTDFTYTVVPVVLWSAIEPTLGLLAANVATYRPLFRKIIDDTTYARSYGTPGTSGMGNTWNKSRRRETSNGYILNNDGVDLRSANQDSMHDGNKGRSQTRCEAIELTDQGSKSDSNSDVNLVIQQRQSIEITVEKHHAM